MLRMLIMFASMLCSFQPVKCGCKDLSQTAVHCGAAALIADDVLARVVLLCCLDLLKCNSCQHTSCVQSEEQCHSLVLNSKRAV